MKFLTSLLTLSFGPLFADFNSFECIFSRSYFDVLLIFSSVSLKKRSEIVESFNTEPFGVQVCLSVNSELPRVRPVSTAPVLQIYPFLSVYPFYFIKTNPFFCLNENGTKTI